LQALGTYDKYFKGQPELVLIVVDLAKVEDEVNWEPSRGGALFPHVYGRLKMDTVVRAMEDWDGVLPTEG
jgi:uncharacterized protein (DUF952 family)